MSLTIRWSREALRLLQAMGVPAFQPAKSQSTAVAGWVRSNGKSVATDESTSVRLPIGDVMECAKTTMPGLYRASSTFEQEDRVNQQSIREILRWMNQPKELAGVLPFCMAMTQIRDAEGDGWVWWPLGTAPR